MWRIPLLLIPAVLCALVGAAYVYVQFSQMIILGFEGKRWSLSSKVYAEPESLYPGLPLRLEDLQASLERLGYRPVQAPLSIRPPVWPRRRAGSAPRRATRRRHRRCRPT